MLGAGPWPTVHAALCARFPHIPSEEWRARLEAGCVCDDTGTPYAADAAFAAGLAVVYTRAVREEPPVAGTVRIVHADERLVVADKPAGLPVMPTGPWVRETLQVRVAEVLGIPAPVPLHRLDRDTAGLVLLSVDPASRAAYQALFRERRIRKVYEALAPALPDLAFPLRRASRLERGEPFFRMREVPGPADAITHIDVLARLGATWRYRLEPETGRKHQLRVHMAGLGAPLQGDALYPGLCLGAGPLALVARALEFTDPIDGSKRRFESDRPLPPIRD